VSILDTIDTSVELISLEQEISVEELRQKLKRLALTLGYADGGFPLVVSTSYNTNNNHQQQQQQQQQWRLVGYISAHELEHGIQRLVTLEPDTDPSRLMCTFRHVIQGQDQEGREGMMRDSMLLSLEEPSDLSVFVDKAPCTVTTTTPLEVVHQMFTKLGIRYLVVLYPNGNFKGLILKKRYVQPDPWQPLQHLTHSLGFLSPAGWLFSLPFHIRFAAIVSCYSDQRTSTIRHKV
jgi:chloride channel 3/4/5